jgi:hypothetical protein
VAVSFIVQLDRGGQFYCSVRSWRSVLLLKATEVPRENH